MAVDPNRAALVTQEYRYATAPNASESAAIKAQYNKAKVIEVQTNLDAVGGAGLAADIASLTSKFVRSFTFVVEGVLYPEDFIGGAPRYTLDFDRYVSIGTNPYAVVGMKVDYINNLTTLTVRGS